LLAKGAIVDAKAGNGATALITASFFGYKDIVNALLANGADTKITASNGMTAVDAASAGQHADIVSILAGANVKR
jgi:ankyrin repeat protein